MARPRIFISSTFYDLRTVRGNLDRFVRDYGFDPVLNERGHIAYGKEAPLETYCYREIKDCDILVCIIGGKLGTGAKDSQYSITQKELKTAIDLSKQIYVFVEKSVQTEFQTYKRNKGQVISFAAVDDVRVYHFLEEIYALPVGNPIFEFDVAADITIILQEQWAGLFQRLLKDIGCHQDEAKRTELSSSNTLCLIGDDQDGTAERCSHIVEHKPRRARLIEMSAKTVEHELKRLLDIKCETDLLLMHPIALKSFPRGNGVPITVWKSSLEWHFARLQHTRRDREFLPNRNLLNILYYPGVPGFRGRHLDKRIEISWYCLRADQPQGVVFGHCNPTLVAHTESEEGEILLKTFETSFNALSSTAVKLDNDAWVAAMTEVEVWLKAVE